MKIAGFVLIAFILSLSLLASETVLTVKLFPDFIEKDAKWGFVGDSEAHFCVDSWEQDLCRNRSGESIPFLNQDTSISAEWMK